MNKYEVIHTDEDLSFYERVNPGFKTTGELLVHTYDDYPLKNCQTTLVVFKGRYTASGMCRDCGDHYIIANYSSYDRIDKGTMKLTRDVEDR